jgi:hypothetical protein
LGELDTMANMTILPFLKSEQLYWQKGPSLAC